ncbi:MAG: hypothetical protein ACTSRP_05105 [Candidatus Helarchaeota archaeon]
MIIDIHENFKKFLILLEDLKNTLDTKSDIDWIKFKQIQKDIKIINKYINSIIDKQKEYLNKLFDNTQNNKLQKIESEIDRFYNKFFKTKNHQIKNDYQEISNLFNFLFLKFPKKFSKENFDYLNRIYQLNHFNGILEKEIFKKIESDPSTKNLPKFIKRLNYLKTYLYLELYLDYYES